ncbi:hypothetical protein KAT51_00560 [bacterium]|nr:hypothetical protein [bacterium]
MNIREVCKTLCWQCGKQAPVNASGVCEKCWEKYAYLREPKVPGKLFRTGGSDKS